MLSINSWTKYIFILLTMLIMACFILAPLFLIIYNAFSDGVAMFFNYISDKEALEAFKLTFQVAFITVIINAIFGLSLSWLVTRYDFIGKNLILTLIDIPLSVSSVISGFIYIITYGIKGYFGPVVEFLDVDIIFALPGLVMVTVFVTIPLIARELIPIMNIISKQYEEAAILLGANSWQSFCKVIFPNVKWALISSSLMCGARAMGEFGAVSVVSGYIRGKTVTIPQYVEILYNEYNIAAALAVSLVLAIIAMGSILIKNNLEK